MALGPDALRQIRREPRDDPSTGTLDAGAAPIFVTAMSVKNTYEIEGVNVSLDQRVNWNGIDEIIVFGRITYNDMLGGVYCTPFIKGRLQNGIWGDINKLTTGFRVTDLCPPGTDSR